MKWTINFDGGIAPINPKGIATCGIVVIKGGKIRKDGAVGNGLIACHKGWVCEEGPGATSNRAEYSALLGAFEYLVDQVREDDEVWVRGDSQLVINQLLGKWKIKAELLLPLYEKVCEYGILFDELGVRVHFKWIRREFNTEADELAGNAYTKNREKCACGGVFVVYSCHLCGAFRASLRTNSEVR